jgi:hypothetical protein
VQLLIYAVVLIGCCILLLMAHSCNHEQQKQVAYFCLFITTLFSAVRGYVGTDTYSYHIMFADNGVEDILDIAKIIEPFFAILIKSTALITDNSFIFTALVSIIQGLILVKLVNTSKNPKDFLAIYIAVFYLNFQFNILRAGTAILLLVLANRMPNDQKNSMKFYLIGIAAVLTHYSAAIGFLPMVFLRQKKASTRLFAAALMVFALALGYYFVIGSEALYGKYLIYSGEFGFEESLATNWSFVFSLPIYFLLYISVVHRKNFLEMSSLFLVWVGLRWVTNTLGFVGRVESIVNALLLFLVIEQILVGWRKQVRSAAILGLTIMWLTGTLINIEDPVIPSGPSFNENYLNSPFTPYRFLWEY